jgi:hypothetical protein
MKNDARIVTAENIAQCCISCNASKSTKELTVWIKSDDCSSRGITIDTVAPVIRNALQRAG